MHSYVLYIITKEQALYIIFAPALLYYALKASCFTLDIFICCHGDDEVTKHMFYIHRLLLTCCINKEPQH